LKKNKKQYQLNTSQTFKCNDLWNRFLDFTIYVLDCFFTVKFVCLWFYWKAK